MKPGALIVALTGSLALFGCAAEEDGAPTIAVDPTPVCLDPGRACVLADVCAEQVAGLRVLYKRAAGQPSVALHLLFDHDAQLFPRSGHQEWAEALTLWSLSALGPRGETSSWWTRRLNELGASLLQDPGVDYASLALEVPRPHFRAALNLMLAALKDPEDSQRYVDSFVRFTRVERERELEQPDTAGRRRALELAWPATPWTRRSEQFAALERVRPEHVKQAAAQLLNKRRLTIVVVGDLEWHDVRRHVERSFGRIRAEAPPAHFEADAVQMPSGGRVAVLPYPASPSWHIYVYLRGPTATDPMRAAVQLGMRVLNDRLFTRLRSELGLAYSTGAQAAFYRQLFLQLWLTTRQPVAGVSAMRDVIAGALLTPPNEAELLAARGHERATLLASLDGSSAVAWTLGDWALTTGAYADIERSLQELESVSAEQIALSWSMYLRGGSIVAAGGGAEAPSITLLDSILPP